MNHTPNCGLGQLAFVIICLVRKGQACLNLGSLMCNCPVAVVAGEVFAGGHGAPRVPLLEAPTRSFGSSEPSGGRLNQFRDRDLGDRKQGGSQFATPGGQLVAVRMRHFLDQAVRAEQLELAGNPARGFALVFLALGFGIKNAPQIAITKSIDGMRSTGDGRQKFLVLRIQRPKATDLFPLEAYSAAKFVEMLVQPPGALACRQGIRKAFGGRMGDPGTAGEVRDTFAQRAPLFVLGAAALLGAEDLEGDGIVQGAFRAQDLRDLVVD